MISYIQAYASITYFFVCLYVFHISAAFIHRRGSSCTMHRTIPPSLGLRHYGTCKLRLLYIQYSISIVMLIQLQILYRLVAQEHRLEIQTTKQYVIAMCDITRIPGAHMLCPTGQELDCLLQASGGP